MGKSRVERGQRISLEANWDTPDIFITFDRQRTLFRSTVGAIVNPILDTYVSPAGVNVELGSGMGELVNNLVADPQLRDSIIQTEQGEGIIAARGQPDVEKLNAKRLARRFQPATVDTFIGFASFDTFADLDQAIQDMTTALKSGGKIIHFLDLTPSPNTFLHNFAATKDKRVPLPWLDEYATLGGYFLVERSRIAQGVATSNVTLTERILINRYIANPEQAYVDFESDLTLLPFAKLIEDMIDHTGVEIINHYDYFYRRLESALIASGLNIDVLEVRNIFRIVDKTAVNDPLAVLRGVNNFAKNEVGHLSYGYDTDLAKFILPSFARIASGVHVAVAQKTNTGIV